MSRDNSLALYNRAKRLIPGGVNSPVRAFKSVDDTPFYVKRAKGAYLFDVDGNEYLDFVSSWGAIILGHADDGLTEAIKAAAEDGTSYGACHPHEIEMAQLITDAFPSIERVRLTSSGTEATMSAVRLARGYTKRQGVIKFRGCYHGHVDSLLVRAGSGLATFGVPDSEGIPADLARHTYVAEFNNIDSVKRILEVRGDDIGCLIIEPIMGNMGVIPPAGDFLSEIEKLCRKAGIVFICDEVITGFRVTYGGAQHLYGIDPDITCLGKIIGGGFPVGAFGGKASIMDALSPTGDVYQAGTLSGNPVAARAGIYTLKYLRDHREIYDYLKETGEILQKSVIAQAEKYGIPYTVNTVTGMFTGFFFRGSVDGYEAAITCDRKVYEKFFKLMLAEGIFFAPSQFEASMLTLCHGEREISRTLDSYERVFRAMAGPS